MALNLNNIVNVLTAKNSFGLNIEDVKGMKNSIGIKKAYLVKIISIEGLFTSRLAGLKYFY